MMTQNNFAEKWTHVSCLDVDRTTIYCKCSQAKFVARGDNTSNLLHHLCHKLALEYHERMELRLALSTSSGKTEKARGHSSQTSFVDAFAKVLQNGLQESFESVQVSVVECPDLTQHPFSFPVKGICGHPRITDVGGVPYLIPLAQIDKVYNMNTVAKEIEMPGAFILGAGAASSKSLGINAELMPLIWTENKDRCAVNSSYYSTVNKKDQTCMLGKYSDKFSDCDIALLGNLYACEGNPGKVVQIMATKRTGEYSLVTAMRKTLEKQYEKPVAMGGTFIIQKGKAKIHIMVNS
ncbi:CK054 hydrolase, partial [Polypterus senegalus]